jgi:uncharacterized Zn finger protein (UPF0148 family)
MGVIYLHDITNTRVGGSAVRNIEMFGSVVGEQAANNVVVVTTKWDLVESSVADQRQRELAENPKFFGTILNRGATMEKYKQGSSPVGIVRSILRKDTRVTLKIQTEMAEGKTIKETEAGGILNRAVEEALKEAEERHQKQIEDLKKSMPNTEALEKIIKMLQESNELRMKELEAKQAALDKTLEEARNTTIGRRVMDLFGAIGKKIVGWFS